ncbi:MFS family permease [Friedmanniella endophytica]|uniref:MFS family permease n=1 Tax=Microlunatus kandeliicorticis TaxID=1759536 RepID=A0A7W3P674_9ACTN|nr:MFS transporter [Microlunatus kandeliicorticis]MBA8794683.1 MFS family permease [Microlunatus kandeliicorticis]
MSVASAARVHPPVTSPSSTDDAAPVRAERVGTPAATIAEPPVARRGWPKSFRALEVRDYRLYLSSQVVATTGLWMQRIAQDWLILQLTGKVSMVGIAVALQFAPVLIFGLFGGVIADRFPKRRILMITQSTAALMAIALGTLALTHTVQAWHVLVIATVLGFVTVVDNPTRQVFVSELVGPQHIRNAVSLNSSVFQLGALVGPAISGALISAVGQGWSFLINAASCLLVVIMLAVIRSKPAAAPGPAAADTVPVERWSEGLHFIRRTPEVGWTIVLVAAMALFGLNMPVILSAFADHIFQTGVGGYSIFNSMTAVGALLGALLSARRSGKLRLRALVGFLAGLGAMLAVASLAPTDWLFAAVLVSVGLCTLLFLTGANSLVQMTATPQLRGRVMSVYLLVLLGGQSVGGPLVGQLVDLIGARASMAVCGLMVLVVCGVAAIKMARASHLHLTWRDRHHGVLPHIVQH